MEILKSTFVFMTKATVLVIFAVLLGSFVIAVQTVFFGETQLSFFALWESLVVHLWEEFGLGLLFSVPLLGLLRMGILGAFNLAPPEKRKQILKMLSKRPD